MKLKEMCILEQTKCKVRSAVVAGVCMIFTLCSAPIASHAGRVQATETFYKEANVQILQTYEWSEILVEKERIGIPSSYITDTGVKKYTGWKALESTNKITAYEAGDLNRASETDEDGFQKYNDRYLVAIGSYFKIKTGQYFDVVLDNGTVIPCIKGDEKANVDTDASNIFSANGCATEFIVTLNELPKNVLQAGNASEYKEEWNSPAVEVIVYENNWKTAPEGE